MLMKSFEHGGKKKTIIAQPDAGLGNRLNSIYSGLYYSRRYNAPLNILWLRENCCNVGFTDLFEIPENVSIHTIYHLGYKNRYAVKSLISDLFMKFFKTRIAYYNSEQTAALFDAKKEEGICSVIENFDTVCFKSYRRNCSKEHFIESMAYLRPNKEIEGRVNEIMCDFADKRVIGIHIRRTDHIVSIKNSSLDSFVSYMKAESQRGTAEGQETVFYLATDDSKIEAELTKEFRCIPHINFSDAKSRSTTAGMKDAFVDMLCLSRCEKIFGSFESTFSQMAAMIGNVPLEIAGNDNKE